MTVSALILALHYLLLGPLAWAYLQGWISPDQWVAISSLFAGATEYVLDGEGPLHAWYVLWITAWEALAQ